MEKHYSGLLTEKEKLASESVTNPDSTKIEANAKQLDDLRLQLKAHVLRYNGVDWREVEEGTAAVRFQAAGTEVEIPIKPSDLNLQSSVVVGSWEELNELEAAFDKYESGEELDEESKKEVQRYIRFIEKVTGLNIDETENQTLREKAQDKYKEWAAEQRMQMVSTDPAKLPIEVRVKIHNKALDNFSNSGRWKGKDYTKNDMDRVAAARRYNDFIANNDFKIASKTWS